MWMEQSVMAKSHKNILFHQAPLNESKALLLWTYEGILSSLFYFFGIHYMQMSIFYA